jgi:hypothetical protein
MMTFGEFAKVLERNAATLRPRLEFGLAKVGELTQTMAAEYIGREMPEWAPLAVSTVREKTRLGFTGHVSATDPRLRTGADRDSIEVVVEGLEQAVGSKRETFKFQELGTAKTPPRPVLALAASRSLEYAAEVFGEIAASTVSPPGAVRR